MSLDGADDDNVSLHSAHTGITNRTNKTAPCLVPGTDDVVTSGVCCVGCVLCGVCCVGCAVWDVQCGVCDVWSV